MIEPVNESIPAVVVGTPNTEPTGGVADRDIPLPTQPTVIWLMASVVTASDRVLASIPVYS